MSLDEIRNVAFLVGTNGVILFEQGLTFCLMYSIEELDLWETHKREA